MVHRKRLPRKKPRDSVVVSKNGLMSDRPRGGRDPGGRGGGGGGGGGFPRYMRPTSSSDARAGRAVGGEAMAAPAAPPKRKAVRAEVVFAGNGKPYSVSRATCSSVMKAAGLTAAAPHVCPYSYCSLKGHAHAPAVPLRSLVASRRRLIKTQQSMKLKGASPFRKTNNAAGDGFFVEIYAGAGATAPTVSSDVCCSDLSTEETDAATARRMEYATFDHRSYGDDEDKAKGSDAASVDGSCGSSDVISGGSIEFLGTKSRGFIKQGTGEEEKAYLDQEAEDFGGCKSDISEELDAKYEEGFSQDGGNGSKPSIDDITCALGGMNFRDECSGAASCQRNKLSTSRRRRAPEEAERMRRFNPRAPNFLPVEPDPEAEKVDLKHQMMGDRKNAEEWMVDYALRRAVNKLARAQKRKVEMLVQAFETVLPPAANEKNPAQHVDDKKSLTIATSLQECS